jgi:RNA polymerase sigma factor (sigma-70 family)
MGNTKLTKQHQLLTAFKNNDTKVMEQVYTTVFPKFRAYVGKNNGSTEAAKDVFQEAFISCWRNIKDDKVAKINIEGYLYQIAKNKWIDHLRASKDTLKLQPTGLYRLAEASKTEEERTAHKEALKRHMREAFAQLGTHCKQILHLFYFERRSMEHISASLNITPASARNQKYRCTQKLRSLTLKNNGRS